MAIRGLVVSLVILAALPGCRSSSDRRADEEAAIREQSARFSRAYVAGDIESMMQIYTGDAVIFPNDSEAITGLEAIRRYWALREGTRVTHHRADATEIRVEGDVASDHGVYEIAGERDGARWGPRRGTYLIVWRRDPSGAWRMQLDMWNSLPDR